MNIEIANKKRHSFLFGKTYIASYFFMAAMVFFSYQVSYAQLDSSDNLSTNTSTSSSSSSNETSTPSLAENGNVSIGSFSSFVNDINSILASNSSKSISNGTTNSQTDDTINQSSIFGRNNDSKHFNVGTSTGKTSRPAIT